MAETASSVKSANVILKKAKGTKSTARYFMAAVMERKKDC